LHGMQVPRSCGNLAARKAMEGLYSAGRGASRPRSCVSASGQGQQQHTTGREPRGMIGGWLLSHLHEGTGGPISQERATRAGGAGGVGRGGEREPGDD
jgi:hypothetical protein